MLTRFSGKERVIVAGVKLPVNRNMALSTISLAKRTNMTLRFVHVVEPWNTLGNTYAGEYMAVDIAKLDQAKRIEEANTDLNNELNKLESDFAFESKVLTGNPAEMIKGEALVSKASLIVSGVQPVNHTFVPRGFSTALGIMGSSSIPVLAFGGDKIYDFENDHLSLMVADDLGQGSVDLMPTIAELSISLKNSDLIHFHCHASSKENMRRWADKVSQMMITQELDYNINFNKDSFISDTERKTLDRLTNRVEVPMSFLDKNQVSYCQKVEFGDVAEQMAKVVKQSKPDLIAFGRHHFLHKQPITIGKIPYYSMLSLGVPIMIVSNIGRLN